VADLDHLLQLQCAAAHYNTRPHIVSSGCAL